MILWLQLAAQLAALDYVTTGENKWQARESTGMFGNRMAIYYIMPQSIQNHSRFVMLMKTCMIS